VKGRMLRRARRGLGPSKLEAMEAIWREGYTLWENNRTGKVGLFRLDAIEKMFHDGMNAYDNLPADVRRAIRNGKL
jgi:hypothetical protein